MPSRHRALLPVPLVLVLALAIAACAPKEKPADVPSADTVACQLDGTRVVIRFLADDSFDEAAKIEEAGGPALQAALDRAMTGARRPR